MNTQPVHRFIAAAYAITCCTLAGQSAIDTPDLPHPVRYELGDAAFATGDSITIQRLSGTSEKILPGETYSVDGTYTLGSRDEADLAFYATTLTASGPTPVDPRQHVRIKRGTGSFHLVKLMNEDGYLHLSLYPVPSGSDFGGVYFGQGDRVLRRQARGSPASLSGPNQILLEYLGNPVEPPVNLDAHYTRQGLSNAVQLAARNAGIALKKVEIEDSEFPFLVGVICAESDFDKLKDQIRKIDGYTYNGSVGSHTCNAINIVPYPAYPREDGQRIGRRTLLRQQVFHDKLSAQE